MMGQPYKSEYPKNILLSSHWYKKGQERTSKRLRESIDIANEYISTRKDVCFWIAGESNYKSNKDQIRMLGHVNIQTLNSLFSLCNCMLNLSYIDSCPNSVVESVVAGLPVVCTNNSGTAEIVGKDGGMVLDLDRELRLKALYIYKKHPPRVDHEKVFKALDYYCEHWTRVNKPELYIENVAKKYVEFFKVILK